MNEWAQPGPNKQMGPKDPKWAQRGPTNEWAQQEPNESPKMGPGPKWEKWITGETGHNGVELWGPPRTIWDHLGTKIYKNKQKIQEILFPILISQMVSYISTNYIVSYINPQYDVPYESH